MAKPNITLNDVEIEMVLTLVRVFRSDYGYTDDDSLIDGPNTIPAQLKRLERKMGRALEHVDTESVQ